MPTRLMPHSWLYSPDCIELTDIKLLLCRSSLSSSLASLLGETVVSTLFTDSASNPLPADNAHVTAAACASTPDLEAPPAVQAISYPSQLDQGTASSSCSTGPGCDGVEAVTPDRQVQADSADRSPAESFQSAALHAMSPRSDESLASSSGGSATSVQSLMKKTDSAWDAHPTGSIQADLSAALASVPDPPSSPSASTACQPRTVEPDLHQPPAGFELVMSTSTLASLELSAAPAATVSPVDAQAAAVAAVTEALGLSDAAGPWISKLPTLAVFPPGRWLVSGVVTDERGAAAAVQLSQLTAAAASVVQRPKTSAAAAAASDVQLPETSAAAAALMQLSQLSAAAESGTTEAGVGSLLTVLEACSSEPTLPTIGTSSGSSSESTTEVGNTGELATSGTGTAGMRLGALSSLCQSTSTPDACIPAGAVTDTGSDTASDLCTATAAAGAQGLAAAAAATSCAYTAERAPDSVSQAVAADRVCTGTDRVVSVPDIGVRFQRAASSPDQSSAARVSPVDCYSPVRVVSFVNSNLAKASPVVISSTAGHSPVNRNSPISTCLEVSNSARTSPDHISSHLGVHASATLQGHQQQSNDKAVAEEPSVGVSGQPLCSALLVCGAAAQEVEGMLEVQPCDLLLHDSLAASQPNCCGLADQCDDGKLRDMTNAAVLKLIEECGGQQSLKELIIADSQCFDYTVDMPLSSTCSSIISICSLANMYA